jgi:DNA-binding MarR family transcriptional regulator
MLGDDNQAYYFHEIAVPHSNERHFGWLTTDISRLMRTVFDRRARHAGVTRTQWLALTRIQRRPGASQSELADMMEIEKAPAGRIIDRLEERGWVERRADPGDRRINRMFLTVDGRRVHAALMPIAQATVNDALQRLSLAEQQLLVGLLENVKSQLALMVETSGHVDGDGFDASEEAVDPERMGEATL